MKFSIITVCYNAAKEIADTFESVFRQTCKDYEYIVVDGASSDGTVDVIQKAKERFESAGVSFRYVSEKDHGIYDAMNKGTALSVGEYIIFMNAGDYFASANVLTEISDDITDGCDCIYGDTVLKQNGKYMYLKAREIDYSISMGACHQSIFVASAVLKKIGFDTRYKYCADHNLLLSMLKENMKFKYINMPISVFLMGGISTSAGFVKMQIENIEVMRDQDLFGEKEAKKQIQKIKRNAKLMQWKAAVRKLLPKKSRLLRARRVHSDYVQDKQYDYIYEG